MAYVKPLDWVGSFSYPEERDHKPTDSWSSECAGLVLTGDVLCSFLRVCPASSEDLALIFDVRPDEDVAACSTLELIFPGRAADDLIIKWLQVVHSSLR